MSETLESIANPWDLLDPGDVLETKSFHTFLFFAKNQNTKSFELLNLNGDQITLMIEGGIGQDTSKIFTQSPVYKINAPEREALVDALSSVKVGKLSKMKKSRMISALKTYLCVT